MKDHKRENIIPGHSVPLAALGSFILFLGFLAFNGGSEKAIVGGGHHGAAVSRAFMNSMIGGCSGAFFALYCHYFQAWATGQYLSLFNKPFY